MKLFILPDFFSGLTPWFIKGEAPKGMPAVYNFFKVLEKKEDITFDGILYNKYVSRTMYFDNGSKLELKKVTLFKSIHLLWKLIAYVLTFFYAVKYLRKHRFNIIYGMAVFSPCAMLLGKMFKTKSVGRVFGTLSSKMIKEKQFFRLYFRNFLDVMAIKFPCDVMISTEDGTEYGFFAKKMNPTKEVNIMYNGIDKNFKKKLLNSYVSGKILNPKKIKIVYVGRLSYWKRQDLAIDSLSYLRANGVDASMTFIGDGPDLNKINEQITKLNLQKHVDFIYGIPQMDLPDLIKQYDISLFLYDNGNLGNALWEACLAGQLVCVKNSGDLKGIFEDGINSIVVEDKSSAESIAKKITEGLLDKNVNLFGQKIQVKVDGIIECWEERINSELTYIKGK